MRSLGWLVGLVLAVVALVVLVRAGQPAGTQPEPVAEAAQSGGCGSEGSGHATPGLPGSGAEILWDSYGVPHIYAHDHEALFAAYGAAQMQAHGDLILRLYGQARARAAEYWGEDLLDSDKDALRMGVPARAEAWLERQTPEARCLLEAFVRGMNAQAAKNPEALDPERRVVLPVKPQDVLAHTQRVIHLTFIARNEVERARSAFEKREAAWHDRGPAHGSNAWAIAPSRSTSGRALLVANPHLPWHDLFTWFEAHLVAPEVNVTGATLVGQNLLGIAFNEHIGWTHTVNTIDAADTYELELADGGYRYDGAVKPFETETHKLRVKREDGSMGEDLLVVKRAVQGPVIAEDGSRALALRVAGLDEPGLADQYWRMMRARSLDEFENAARALQMPLFTVMYADRDGHILHLFGGRTPRRPASDVDWTGTVPGDTSRTLWTAVHPYEDLPRLVDPSTGWLQNANDPPWTTTFPAALDPDRFPRYMAPRGMQFRAQRSVRMLAEDPSITWDEVLAYKQSTRMEGADRILDDIAAAVKAHASGDVAALRGLAILEKWDRTADNDSRGGVLFSEWVDRLEQRGDPFAVPWSEGRARETPDGLKDPRAAVAELAAAVRAVEKDFGAADARWGDVHRLRRDGLDLPANGAPEYLGGFRVTSYRKDDDGRYRAAGGDSYVAVVEFGSPLRARTLVGYGNWSQRGSRHRTDQLALYSRKELKPVWLTRAEVEANLERREAF